MAHGQNSLEKELKKGFDYSGKRPGNESQCNSPSKHKGTKKITHRLERILNKKEIDNSLIEINFYQSIFYSEICPSCGKDISYKSIFGDRGLTMDDYKILKCPSCASLILPCDYCKDFHYSLPDCNKCKFKELL